MCLVRPAVFLLVAAASVSAVAVDVPDFNRDVRPILSDRCFVCHGPDAEQRQADLRLDVEESATAEVIVPGHPEDSELVARILADDPDVRMPPPEFGVSLSESEQNVLIEWIRSGASWDQHWAFVPLKPQRVPEVGHSDWPVGPIDHFVLLRLQEEGLEPAPRASREVLLRRAAFDLTGLPPSPDDLDRFLNDDAPDAWSKAIDRLLASPAFGERMASVWLDLARYSDTYGYQVDRDRFVWPWRDWVIRAFNSNMPHDEFIVRQLAGDLLPDASEDDILATTFCRLHPQKAEGGSVPEEFRVEYVADRTQTFATAFLGLTMECCRCHDHKYDPLSQKEYYQLSAYFDKIDEAGLYSYHTSSTPTPTLMLPTPLQRQRMDRAAAAVTAAEARLQDVLAAAAGDFEQWLSSGRTAAATDSDVLIPGRLLHSDFEQPPGGASRQVPGISGQAVQFSGDDAVDTGTGRFRRDDPFTVAVWLQTPDVKERAVIWHCSMGWTDAASRGYQLLMKDGRLHASLIHFWPGNAISVATSDPFPTGEWHHVVVRYDGSSRAAGLNILIDGQPTDTVVVRDSLTKTISGGKQHLVLGARDRDRGFTGGLADELDVFDRFLTDLEVRHLFDGHSLTDTLQMPPERLDSEQRRQLFDYYAATRHAEVRKQRSLLKQRRIERSEAVEGVPEIMVMRQSETPRQTWLLNRGAYDDRREPVQPAVPKVLSRPQDPVPADRLELARWLTSPQHPLTARVAVNRFWQIMFGQGLVRTPEDFGSQGRPPTHPELLDWLALDFMQHGWDVRRLLKQIALSSTWCQSSAASEQTLARDPENLWLSRSPAFRLPAEMLRDQALAVSGLLVRQVGGPPARPYEVAVSFKPVPRDTGDGLYRRSVYTYWKRTGPAPAMMVLDAVKRDVCRVSRERTESPLEAFVLLNGPQFVEASRVLAERLLRQHATASAALPDLFRRLTSREASDDERVILRRLLEQQQAYFSENPDQARQFLAVGEATVDAGADPVSVAALAAVAGALFSYDECVIRR